MSQESGAARPVPVQRAAQALAYALPKLPPTVDLFLDANEAPVPAVDLGALAARLGPDVACRYATATTLESDLARGFGIAPECVLATAGCDHAIELVCRAFLEPGRELLMGWPSFEMIAKHARLTGATVREVEWGAGAFPVEAMVGGMSEHTGVVAVVSPNNPTGAVVAPEQVRHLAREAARRAPRAVMLVDLAYAEFAEVDLTPVALETPAAVCVRTFSKAYGLAGLRVGYAMGDARVIGVLRAIASPFPVSRVALESARLALAERAAARADGTSGFVDQLVAQVARERAAISTALARPRDEARRATPRPSQGNFLLLEFASSAIAHAVHADLLERGISVRRHPAEGALGHALRVTCPGRQDWCERLLGALAEIGLATP